MKTRRYAALVAALVAVTGAVTVWCAAAPPDGGVKADREPKRCKPCPKGCKLAPDFALFDCRGDLHALSDYRGRIVVLEWIDPGCRTCKRVCSNGTMRKMIKDLEEVDPTVKLFTICSSDAEPEKIAEFLRRYKVECPALTDPDGEVARAYEAKTTPHCFVIDEGGYIRYSGAIDDNAKGRRTKTARNYVVNAVKQIRDGSAVVPATTRPYGGKIEHPG